MKKYFFTSLLLVILLIGTPLARAQSGDAEIELRPSATTATQGQEFTVDIALKNPSAQKVISVRAWLTYDSALLDAEAIVTQNSPFTLAAPGEDTVTPEEGKVKIGRANISGGFADKEGVIAQVKFKVKTASAATATIAPFDYQVTELGHTNVNIIEQGFPLNILAKAPAPLSIGLNAGAAAAAPPVQPATPAPAPVAPVGGGTVPTLPGFAIARPTGLKVNTASGSVDLQWDVVKPVNPQITGYNLYWGKTSGAYTRRRTVNLGELASEPSPDRKGYSHFVGHLDGLNNNDTVYFALTAVDAYGRESDYSDEVGVIINQPLSSTSAFAGVLEALLGRIPGQPQNGPLMNWAIVFAVSLSGAILLRNKKQTEKFPS